MTAVLGDYCLALVVLAAVGGVLTAVASAWLNMPSLLRRTRGDLPDGRSADRQQPGRGDCHPERRFQPGLRGQLLRAGVPTGYKLAALWAGQEGSLLLWAWLLAGLAALAVCLRRKDAPHHQAPAVAILAAICAAFAAMLLFAANPFQLGHLVPADGEGLNPLLQNPAMAAHPPMLFLGYAALAVPMATFLAALISGRRDRAWVASAQRWAVGAWLFLTVGILLGAQWAYVELGWGGYWAWDPVENASLLPWLTTTALLHCLIAQQRTGGMLKAWGAGLAISSFLLCIFGTYLTRSGVVASVHSFPRSPIGWFFLVMLVAGSVGSAGVMVWRRGLLNSDRRIEGLLSREGAFLAASALLVVMMLATLAGTIFPVLAKPFTHRPVTVGPEFYNTVVLPMGLALAALMALAPLLGPAEGATRPGRRFFLPALAAAHAAVLAGILGDWSPWMMGCAAVAGFAALAIGQDLVRAVIARGRPAGAGPGGPQAGWAFGAAGPSRAVQAACRPAGPPWHGDAPDGRGRVQPLQPQDGPVPGPRAGRRPRALHAEAG